MKFKTLVFLIGLTHFVSAQKIISGSYCTKKKLGEAHTCITFTTNNKFAYHEDAMYEEGLSNSGVGYYTLSENKLTLIVKYDDTTQITKIADLDLNDSITLRLAPVGLFTKEPLPFATIVVKDSSLNVLSSGVTNIDGALQLRLPRRIRKINMSVLFIGFSKREIPINIFGSSHIQFTVPPQAYKSWYPGSSYVFAVLKQARRSLTLKIDNRILKLYKE